MRKEEETNKNIRVTWNSYNLECLETERKTGGKIGAWSRTELGTSSGKKKAKSRKSKKGKK